MSQTAVLSEVGCEAQGRVREKNFFRPPPLPGKVGLAKNLYTKSERLTLSWRVTCALSERVNWYNRRIMNGTTVNGARGSTMLHML
jgi:hypothetical protein